MEGTSKKTNVGFSVVADTLRQMRRDDATASAASRKSTITAADNMSVPFRLSEAEEAEIENCMRQTASKAGNALVANADSFWLRACLRARKGDVERANALASNYLKWRRDVHYARYVRGGLSPSVHAILSTGAFLVAGNYSRDERPVLTVRYRYFNPRRFAAVDVARALGAVVEFLLREYPASQSHGIVVLDDTAGFSFSNFDIRVFRFLEKAFAQVLPIRIAAIHIVNPGWVIRTIFNLVSGFMSRKIKARIMICDAGDVNKIQTSFEPQHIPKFINLGGTLEWTDAHQKQFVERVSELCLIWPASSSHPHGE